MVSYLIDLLKENFDYNISNIHTAFPGVIKKYDVNTRRAEIQPSLKRKLSNGKFIELPIIVDVPVLFLGTKTSGIHFPLKEKDEVLVICCERSLDSWKDKGGDKIEDNEIRKFSIPDAVAIGGLQAKDFNNIADKENLTIYDDKKIVINNKKTKITIEDENVTIDNGKVKIKIDGSNIELFSNTGKLKLGNSVATIGSLLSDLCTELIGATTINCVPGSPVTFNPATIAKITAIKTKAGQVLN